MSSVLFFERKFKEYKDLADELVKEKENAKVYARKLAEARKEVIRLNNELIQKVRE